MSNPIPFPLSPEPGRVVRPPKAAGSARLAALAAGAANLARVRVGLAASRHRGRTGTDDAAGAGGYRLRGGIGVTGHLWPLCNHRPAAGICVVRPQSYPGAGPDSALAAVILAVVLPLSGGDPLRAVTLASMMAVVSGVVCVLAGMARLGFITELLSKPIPTGT